MTRGPFSITMSGWQELWRRMAAGSVQKSASIIQGRSPSLERPVELAFNHNLTTRELMILIPGTFGNVDSGEVVALAEFFYERGMSTLRMPNPLSQEIVAAVPTYHGFNFESEANYYLKMIEPLIREHGFERVHLMGASYGAFVVSVMAGMIDPGILGKVAVIGPPKNMLSSLECIDALFDGYSSTVGRLQFEHIGSALKMFRAVKAGRIYEMSEAVSKSFFVQFVFHRGFCHLITSLEDRQRRALVPSSITKFLSPSYRRERIAKRFVRHARLTSPEFFADPRKHELKYWLDRLPSASRVYTSHDDPINPPKAWTSDDARTVLYANGGHFVGFMGQDEFWDDLAAFFIKRFDSKSRIA